MAGSRSTERLERISHRFSSGTAYLPVFWTLPSPFLTETAALGGFLGPFVLRKIQTLTGSFVGGIYFLCASMALSATMLFLLGLGGKGCADDPAVDF